MVRNSYALQRPADAPEQITIRSLDVLDRPTSSSPVRASVQLLVKHIRDIYHLRRLILVAYVLDLSHAFEKACGGLAVALTADKVESLDMHRVPDKLKGWSLS